MQNTPDRMTLRPHFKSDIPMPDITTTVSSMETTGMMPRLPPGSEEYGSYQDLAGMQIPEIDFDEIGKIDESEYNRRFHDRDIRKREK